MKTKYVVLMLITVLIFSLMATYAIMVATNGLEFWHTMDFSSVNETQLLNQGYEKRDYDQVYINEIEAVGDFSISSSSTDIEVQFRNGQQFKVYLEGYYYLKNGKVPLELVETLENGRLEYKLLYTNDTLFRFVNSFQAKLIVMIPEDYEGRITISNSSGNTEFLNDNKYNSNIKLSTVSGNIKALKIDANDIVLTTSSGNIKTDDIKNATDFSASAVSGDIEINYLAAEDIDLSSSSGNIEMMVIEGEDIIAESISGDIDVSSILGNTIKVSTSSGSIDMRGVSGTTEIKSVSGDIDIQFESGISSGQIRSSSGRIIAEIDEDESFSYVYSTSSGSFSIEFEGLLTSTDRQYEGDINGGGNMLSFQTSSGNLKIRKTGR